MSEITVFNSKVNQKRIWSCGECPAIFSEEDLRTDAETKKWGHVCKCKKYKTEHRCESYLTPYIPEESK